MRPTTSSTRDTGSRNRPAGRGPSRPSGAKGAGRTSDGSGAGRSPSGSPGGASASRRPRRPTGRLTPRGVVALVAGALVVLGLVLAAVLWWGDDDAAPGTAVDPARVAELEAAEAARDAENLVVVIDHARDTQAELVPVLEGLWFALPLDGSPAVLPEATDVAAWRAVVDDLAERSDQVPTGSTEHNIVRSGIMVSVDLLGDALDALDLARDTAGEDGERLRALASDLRSRAVDAWGLAAMQLDVLSTAGGQGHVHVFLPVRPGDALDGGLDEHGH